MGHKEKAWNKRCYVGVIYCRKIADKETDDLDSIALYFDLVYDQNGSTRVEFSKVAIVLTCDTCDLLSITV